ncbi:hypothetical protein [Wolbachia endosymbiont (group E) of Neria commutata]|uniref:hypothetical protein n=1 Tax=Wolbachia endosymbiont (group E) of Neria commutata TaxID=3066149 RepID=UPI003132B645
MANTKLLSQIPGDKQESVKDLLKKVAELKDTGKNEGFRQDFHKFAKDSYNLDTSKLEGKNSAELQPLAKQLKNLTPGQIKALSAKVDELKKDQDRGPKTQKNEVKTSKPEIGAMLDL